MTTPELGLEEISGTPANAGVLLNELHRILEKGALRFRIEEVRSSPPGTCADGAAYIAGSSPSGDWSGFFQHDVIIAKGVNAVNGWINKTPNEGWRAYDQNAGVGGSFSGSAWQWVVHATLTDSTGGTTDGDLAAIAGTGDDTNINNNNAEIWAKLNDLETQINKLR